MSSDGPRRELTHTYAPGPDVVVPDLAGLPGAARSDYPLTVELTTTYVDTEDLALARAGVRLSVLTGGDEGWLLVLPWTGRDSVVRAPLGPNPAEVPAALRDLVQGWVRDRDLVEAGRVEVARTGRDVLDRDDAVVARLVDDVATGTVDGQEPLGWRRWSLRSTQAAVLAAADRLMSDAGVPPDDAIDDVARLLGDRLPGRDDPDHLGRRVPVKRVVGARLREQHAALLRADLEMRRGNEHGVHQARVALRRLRSALATFRPAMERTASEQLREELGWLSRALGAARDRHVVRGRLVALATGEDELAGPVLERIRSASWTSDSDTSVAEVLSSPRCFALLGSLDEFVGSPPWTDRADRKAGRYLQRRVAKEWARVADRVAPVADLDPGTAPDEALHEIRKAAKRLRYALETAELVWPRKPKRLRKRVRDLTELLGERQDTVVTRSALLELAAEADAAGEPTFTHGRLDRIEELHAAELEERFHRAWSAAVDQRTDWP